ncbi:hypothetical protein M427DRAFT_444526 [Gonapodya prolifera JEL478]|uniref:Uncharacterized protein n=1 Tax=Gonapodya prolifera (strain JEL478) TaxID=1344416 RepID=A0A139A432_GONPJ|nr:hypothetical protein M427DRAFT_444526 [Gonapodya prolifera JEL478]|eukprot:KXS11225.1 hypothetical protein M427DRAFT_444526 [Gonapodya prolifera JEL478]
MHQCADLVVRVEGSRSPSEAPPWDSLSPTASLSDDSLPSAAPWVRPPPPPEHRRSLSGNQLARCSSGEPLSGNGGERLDAQAGACPPRPTSLIPLTPGHDAPWPTPPHLSRQPTAQNQTFGDSGSWSAGGFDGGIPPDQYGSVDRLASKPVRFTGQQGPTPAVMPTGLQDVSADGQKRRPWEEGGLAEDHYTRTSLLPLQPPRGFPSLRPESLGFGAPTPLSPPNVPFMPPPSSSSTYTQATTSSNLNQHIQQAEFPPRTSLYSQHTTIEASRPPLTSAYNIGSSFLADHFPPPHNLSNSSTYQYAQLHNGQGVQSGTAPRPSMLSQPFPNRLDYPTSDTMVQSMHNRMRSLGNITTDYSTSGSMVQSVHNRMRSLGNVTTDQQLFRDVNRPLHAHNGAGLLHPLHTAGPTSIYQHSTSIPPYRDPMPSVPPQLTYPVGGGDLGFGNGYTRAPLPQAFGGINRPGYDWGTAEVDPSRLGYRNGFPSGQLAGWPPNR